MSDQAMEASTSAPWLHARREPFDFGLLSIPGLASYKDCPVENLKVLRQRLLQAALAESPSQEAQEHEPRIPCSVIASCLKLSKDQARLVVDTLAAILPTDNEDIDPLADAQQDEIEKYGADVDLLVLFLFLQRYKRMPHRSVRDATVLADVWPQGPSPFDAVSPGASSALQLKTSLATRQRYQMGQAEEEAHQLAFIQKHLPAILHLLAEPAAEGADEVIAIDKFDLLGFFLRVNRPGSPSSVVSSVAPFFADTDPNMNPPPVALQVVVDWVTPRLSLTSAHGQELRAPSPRTVHSPPAATSPAGGLVASGASSDVHMSEAGAGGGQGDAQAGAAGPASGAAAAANGPLSSGSKRSWQAAGMTTIDGVAKMSILKGESEVDSGCVRVAHCHDSVVYVLAPLKYASVIGCSDSIVVLGAVGKSVRVESCERVHLIVPCARIRIVNCRECTFYLGSNSRPVILGDNHNLQIAPYNTFYPRLDYHLAKARVDANTNKWDCPLNLGSLEGHDLSPLSTPRASTAASTSSSFSSSSSPSSASPEEGAAAAAQEANLLMPPEKYVPFVVPFRSMQELQGGGVGGGTGGASLLQQQTRANPFALPKAYVLALQQKTKTVENLRQTLKTAVLEESKKRELTNVIQAHFKEWLITSGNIRQVYDLARLDRE